MTIIPFCGTIFNPEKFPNLTDILAPPYDVISPEERRFFVGRSRFNTARLILGEEKQGDYFEDSFYSNAKDLMKKWLQDGDLIHLEQPGIFYLHQFFQGPDGAEHIRKGFIALMPIEEYGADTVRAHERTMHGPIHDRLRLTKTARTNFSQIFFTYQDEHNRIIQLLDEAIAKATLMMDGEELASGVENICYLIQDEETINAIQELMEPEPVFIADGHHRYETLKQYRDERTAETGLSETDASYVMGYFACAQDPGLQIYPTHRTLPKFDEFSERTLSDGILKYFDSVKIDSDDIELGHDHRNLIMARPSGDCVMLRLKDEYYLELKHSLADPLLAEMDTVVLEEIILKRILNLPEERIHSHGFLGFHRDIKEFWDAFQNDAEVGWILNYPNAQVVFELAGRGQRLPQKTTYFYPKLPTGFVFRQLED
jgi:uncharacterized protein (DUF1015 family)